ncbi:MAG: nicotinate phosphoribosyltransferase, partial [Candidatus Heimdallarchaeaceae archaeon]
CLREDGLEKTRVCAEITTHSLPRNWNNFLFLGLGEVLELFKKANLKVDVYTIEEGSILPIKDYNGVTIPVLIVEGEYGEFGIYETPMLGLVCYQSGVGTSAMRVRLAAKEKTILSFGVRRMHPAIAPVIDRACYIAGFDGVSCILSAEKLNIMPIGTVPHAFIMIEGGIKNAMQSYDKHLDPEINRIALSDTFNDERFEVMNAIEAIGEKLDGVRLDTPGSRRGDFREIIQEIKWELKRIGRSDIKIFLSGGFNEETVEEFRDIVDGFGVGTSVANSPTINFAFDIVEIEEKPIAKRGKYPGKKQVGYCKECQTYLCKPFNSKEITCPKCDKQMELLLKQYMRKGEIIKELPDEREIREYVKSQLRYKEKK